jgi:hypothetical protein
MVLVIGAAGAGGMMALAVAVLVAAAAVAALVSAFLRWRGTRLVRCPETRRPVAVRLDLPHVVLSSLVAETDLRLKDCTRWPERRDCGQECLPQIARAPEDCRVVHIVGEWYHGKHCVYCGEPFDVIRWHDRQPAVRSPQGVTLQWSELAPETLPEVFATHAPVCWNCHIAESFRREHPELVVERPLPPETRPRPHGAHHPPAS